MQTGIRERRHTYLIFSIAFAVRAVFLFYFAPIEIRGDEVNYWNLAREVIRGTYAERFFLPLWPHLMAGAVAIWDHDYAPRLLNVLLASISVALVYRIAARVFEGRTALVAGLLYALYPEHVLYSAYSYAEVSLELFILTGVMVYFGRWPIMPSQARAAAAFFILGVGTLTKHFTVIAWAALLAGALLSSRVDRIRLTVVSLVYFIPAIAFSIWAGVKAGDPLALINTPIKSALESHSQNPGGRFAIEERDNLLHKGIGLAKDKSLAESVDDAWQNLCNLWTPNSYVSGRFRESYYAWGNSRTIPNGVAVCQVLVLVAGLIGFACGPRNAFRTYSGWSILLLSAMSVLWFMVSRYRIPVLHVFVLWSAFLVTHRPYVMNSLKKPANAWLAGGLVAVVVLISIVRWGTIGGWP